MIKLEEVFVKYKKSKYALKNINLEIGKGKCIALIGKSGCGKTSVTRLINGLIPNYYGVEFKGNITIGTLDLKESDIPGISNYVGSVFQNPKSQFFTTNTTSELVFSCENHGLDTDTIDKKLISTVDSLDIKKLLNRNIFKLSAGEKQLIAVGSVYTYDPLIYVFDEPSSNLDILGINKLRKLLIELKNKGKTIILSEHRIYYLMDIVDEFIYLEDGEIRDIFTSAELRNMNRDLRYTRGLRILEPRELLLNHNSKFTGREKSITIKNLSIKRNKKEIVYIHELNFKKGEIIAVIGPNGVGKSTLISGLMGLIDFSGYIMLLNNLMSKKDLLENGFLVMQDVNRQIFSETIEEEITLGYKKDEPKLNYLLNKLGMHEYKNCKPSELSGGQKQRLAIASAIYSKKNILFFDEPTSGLDKKSLMDFQNLLREIRDDFINMFIITHDPELIFNLADNVLLLKGNGDFTLIPMDDYGIKVIGDYFIRNMTYN